MSESEKKDKKEKSFGEMMREDIDSEIEMEHNNLEARLDRIEESLSDISDKLSCLKGIADFVDVVKWVLYVVCVYGLFLLVKDFFK